MDPLAGIPIVEDYRTFVPPALRIAVIVLVAIVVLRLARLWVERAIRAVMLRRRADGEPVDEAGERRVRTLGRAFERGLRLVVIVIAGLSILGQFGIDVGPAIAGLGVGSIAIGLGAQSIVRDVLRGAFILYDDQYAAGDVVRIAGITGTVEDFNLRRTILRDADGTIHSVPNGEIGVSSNLTRTFAQVNIDLPVEHRTDVDRARDVIDDVGRTFAGDAEWAAAIIEPPRFGGVVGLGEGGIVLRAEATVRAPDRWRFAAELRRRLVTAFASSGVELVSRRIVVAERPPTSPPAGPAPAKPAGPAPAPPSDSRPA